ncbi:MAG: hypothetical protein WD825_06880 [Gemmatimonadaceae bacterium]
MKITLITLAQYAAIAEGNKLVIAGTIDQLEVQRVGGGPITEKMPIGLPPFFIAVSAHCSIAEGTEHVMQLMIRDQDGNPVLPEPIALGTWTLRINKYGRPMRHNQVIAVNGLALPGPGDYTFELQDNGQPTEGGETPLYIVDTTPEQ